MNKIKPLIVTVCIICVFTPRAAADIIIFKDGTQAVGKVANIANNQVGIQADAGLYYVSLDKVRNIIYVKPIKEDDTMKWVIGASIVGAILLSFSLAMWGRYL